MKRTWVIALLLAAGCQELEPREVGRRVNLTGINAGVVVAGTDFQRGAGVADFIALDPPAARFQTFRDLELLSADPVVQAFPEVDPDHIWVINRLGFDNIQVLSPGHNFTTVAQFSVGNGANPQDILVLSADKAYVTRYEPPYNDVLIVHPVRGTALGKIPLAAFASNPDQLPRPAAMARAGDYAFIALQNLDALYNWGADDMEPGRLVVVNVHTDAVVDADSATAEPDPIVLSTRNPAGLVFSPTADRILVASSGLFVRYHPEWSGVEVVNPHTLQSEAVLFWGDDPDIHGNIEDLVVAPDQTGYLLVSTFTAQQTFSSRVIQVDFGGGGFVSDIYTAAADAMLSDLILDPQGLLLIADRWSKRPGLVVYDTRTAEFLAPILLEPAPFALALWHR